MDKKINVALVGNYKGFQETYENLDQTKFIVSPFFQLKEITNTAYYEVILLTEQFISTFKPEQFPNSAVIILTDSAQKVTELFPKLKTINAYTVIALPVDETKLAKYIVEANTNLIENKTKNAGRSDTGKSILITSFSNGSGKSLLSYNLSAKVAQFFPENAVCLTDMNAPLSVSKAMLNIEDQYNWQILKPVLQEGIVDKQKVANIIYLTKYRFSLLGGPSDLTKNQMLSTKEFNNLDISLKKIFKSVVYDFRTVSSEKDLSYFETVDSVIVVVDLTSTSILQTIRGIQYIQNNNPELLEKIKFVVNKVDEGKGRSIELISSRLEIKPFGTIDNDPEAVNTFMENGQLFEDKTLLVDRQIYTIAESLVKEFY